MADSILQGKKLIHPIRRIKPGENTRYLILVKNPESDETFWEFITGREEVYKYIRDNIDIIDPLKSYIFANKMKEIDFDNLHTIYDFTKWVKEKNNIEDDFDIEEYVINNNSNIDNVTNIGVGLETRGNTFIGVAGSFYSDDDK